jgi:hypothetical protein
MKHPEVKSEVAAGKNLNDGITVAAAAPGSEAPGPQECGDFEDIAIWSGPLAVYRPTIVSGESPDPMA